MKAPDFDYERPDSLDGVLALLADNTTDMQLLAGGQSLMPMMNFRLAAPDVVIDLNAVDELQFIEDAGDAIEIGAMTHYCTLEAAPLVRDNVPLFGMALPHIAHSAIRNRGTIGGSAALADPAAEMPALLLALNATMTVVSKDREQRIPANEFFLGLYETALRHGELIKSISVPKAGPADRYGFYELARRHGDYAMAGAAIAARPAGPVSGMRVVLFGVSDRALRVPAAEQAFPGLNLDDAGALAEVLDSVSGLDIHADLHADKQTKIHLARVVIERALRDMLQ